MKINEEIQKFDYYDQDSRYGEADIRKLIETPRRKDWVKQLIGIRLKNNEYVLINLIGDSETIVSGLYWQNFSNTELIQIAEKFDLRIEKIESIENKNNLVLDIDNDNFQSAANIAFRSITEKEACVLVIFNFDDGESRRSPQLYVHGIWEVELSEEFKKELLYK